MKTGTVSTVPFVSGIIKAPYGAIIIHYPKVDTDLAKRDFCLAT